MTRDEYTSFADEIQSAGFYTTALERHGAWSRTCVCSQRRPQGGYTGNSFWVTRIKDRWYLGTWGSWIYRLPDNCRVADFCIAWLSHKPTPTTADFDADFVDRFGLIPATDDFDKVVGDL
jgi:hypothetical protein